MNEIELFFKLIRLGIGSDGKESARRVMLPEKIDWNKIKDMADNQGLTAIVLDGVEQLPEDTRPPKLLLLEWIGEVLQSYEQQYSAYEKAIGTLGAFYNVHGYKMMVIKGYACSLDWIIPNHRPCGDIDIWQFGQWKEADAVLAKEKGIEIDNSHHQHTVFMWRGIMVENHYDFINVHHHPSNSELEGIFKLLGHEYSYFVEVNGERVYLPSPNLHALFLLKHTMNDFTSFSITLRQVLDWAFFVEKQGSKVDWGWMAEVLKEFHMTDFFNCMNAICVEDLGFEASMFHGVQFKPEMKEKVLSDILNPKFTAAEPSLLIPRLLYKIKRWKGNRWKHEMCYNESMWSSFWYGVWGHLLKPKSI